MTQSTSMVILLVCMFFVNSCSSTNYQFKGVVVDESGSAVPGAKIRAYTCSEDFYGFIEHGSTLTDASGRFVLNTSSLPENIEASKNNKLSGIVNPAPVKFLQFTLLPREEYNLRLRANHY